MAVKPLWSSPPQFVDANGDPYSGAFLFFYVAGSVNTKQDTFTDDTGGTASPNPITLNSSGYPAVSGTVFVPFGTTGQTYKIGLAAPGSADPPASFIWTADDISPINDTSVSIDQWVAGPTPTYVSATQFTLAGDQTSAFHVGRRVKTTNSGGTVYGTITASAYAALTTVTLLNNSGSLDAGLSAVSYGLLTSVNGSVPAFAAGTAAIPTLMIRDALNGFYSPAANQLGMAIGGSQRMGMSSSIITFSGSVTGGVSSFNFNNDSNSAATDGARLTVGVGGSSAGDPFIRLNVSGVSDFVIGIDNSDTDSFVVSRGSALGTTNALRIDATGAIQTGGTATAGSGYAANGDITLPVGGVIRARNASKAWAYVTNGTPTLVASFNVTSLTDNGTGDVSINLTVAVADANGAATATVEGTSFGRVAGIHSKSTTAVRVITDDGGGGSADQNFSVNLMATSA